MTEDDLVKTYEQATHNALVYGTGFVRVALVKGTLEVSVVDPKDYRYIEPIEAGQWGASSVERPEYIAEQEAKTRALRLLMDQGKEKS